MKKTFLLFFILFLAIFSGCKEDKPIGGEENERLFPAEKDREFDKGSSIVFPELSEQLTDDLDLLGRIWGFLKYHHPEVGKGNYNWDYELFRILPKYIQVKNNEERDKVILEWINKYGEISVCSTCLETPADAYIKPNLLWVENSNMNLVLKAKIKEIYQNRHQGEHYYIKITAIGYPEFFHEYLYSNMLFPDAGFRLLSLYRYWNIIQYFFPYKYLTDKNWDDVLREYIPMFITAQNRLEYELVTTQMVAEINDTHASFSGRARIEETRGDNYAPFQIRFIERKLVVTLYYNPELKESSDPEIGDVITHINGEAVESIVENMKKYYPASNEAARLRDMSFNLLRSNQNTIAINYSSMGQSNRQKDLQLYKRNLLKIHSWNDGWYKVNKNEKCYRLIDENIGYVTLASIKDGDHSEIKSSFKDIKGIIIDIRNYPSSFGEWFKLSGYFVSGSVSFVKFTHGNADNPGEFTFVSGHKPPYTGETYQGKLIVLINEITQSQAEFSSMAFRAGINTTIIGSTTAGADGNVTYINLPGGLVTGISGIGVYYPDGRGTQRVGIIPDIWVEPTIEGIREGRDELLEMAVKLINDL